MTNFRKLNRKQNSWMWKAFETMASISLLTIFLIKTSMSQVTFADNNFLTGICFFMFAIQNRRLCCFQETRECQLCHHLISLFPGSNDIVAVIGEDGEFRASPFSVQFGKRWKIVSCDYYLLWSRQEGHLAAEVGSRGQPRGQQPRCAGQHGPRQRGPGILPPQGRSRSVVTNALWLDTSPSGKLYIHTFTLQVI